MKKVHIIYNPYSKKFAICEKLHKHFCEESTKTKSLEETIGFIKKLTRKCYYKKRIEFTLYDPTHSMIDKDKIKLKKSIKKIFPKAIYKKNKNAPAEIRTRV